MKLKDAVVILTGASDGIGKSIALKLAREGCQLALIGRDANKLAAVLSEVQSLSHAHAITYSCDITDFTQLEKTVEQIKLDFPQGPNILINNAGIWHKKMDLDALDPLLIEHVIQTNLTSHIQLTRLILPGLRKAQYAALINVISRSGVTAQDGQSVYSASKWGMKGFTDVLRVDLKNTKIRIGAVYQGGTHTNLFEKAGETFSTDAFTEPDDLADVIVFMLSRPPKIWLPEVHVQY